MGGSKEAKKVKIDRQRVWNQGHPGEGRSLSELHCRGLVLRGIEMERENDFAHG